MQSRIRSHILTNPVFRFPDNIETYGASDIIARNQEMVPFAFVQGTRGGLTQKFSVLYPVWIINTSVTANLTPQCGRLRMVLCDAQDGSIIEGEEILNRGSSYRLVQVSNKEMYMIIGTAYIAITSAWRPHGIITISSDPRKGVHNCFFFAYDPFIILIRKLFSHNHAIVRIFFVRHFFLITNRSPEIFSQSTHQALPEIFQADLDCISLTITTENQKFYRINMHFVG